jgi:PAS domain S-box-containing protein
MNPELERYQSFSSFPLESTEELYEDAPCAYLSISPAGLIVRANGKLAGWLGYATDELVRQKRLVDLLSANGKLLYQGHFDAALAARDDIHGFVLEFQARDGSTVPVLIHARQVRDSGGVPILTRITVVNTADQRCYEEQLEEARQHSNLISTELTNSNNALLKANVELGEFTYAVSHELQEPLRTMAAYAQLLTARYRERLDGDALAFLENIVAGSHRMETLLGDLLSFSKAKDPSLILRRTDLRQPLQLATTKLRSSIEESHATVTYGELPSLPIDMSRVTQLFENLLGNAIKYGKPNQPPQIEVSCGCFSEECTVSVQDNGIGFEDNYAEQIFGLFKRLHGRDVPGTGIGLAVCRKIVESHGGRIWAESTPGVGSKFSFTIPVGAV